MSDDPKQARLRARLAAAEARIVAALDALAKDHKEAQRLRAKLAVAPPAPAAPPSTPRPTKAAPRPRRARAPKRPVDKSAMRNLRRAQRQLEALGVKPYKPKPARKPAPGA